jgi:DNA-binding MarR family transcriptional regulator
MLPMRMILRRQPRAVVRRAGSPPARGPGSGTRARGERAGAASPGREERPFWSGVLAPDRDPRPGLAVDAPERRRLPLLLRRAWYGLNQAFRHLTARAGITPDQFTVLRTLREHAAHRLTQRDLVEKMSSDPNTIASLVQRMEQQGWIERRRHPEDGRAHALALRRAGRRKYSQVRRQAVALQESILSSLPASGREAFLRQLELIGNACREAAQVRSRRGQGVRL